MNANGQRPPPETHQRDKAVAGDPEATKARSGSIARVPAAEIETLVLDGIRKHCASLGDAEHLIAIADRDLIERHVQSVIVKRQALEVHLVLASETSAPTEDRSINDPAPGQLPTTIINLAWMSPNFAAGKGIVHESSAKPKLKLASRDEANRSTCKKINGS